MGESSYPKLGIGGEVCQEFIAAFHQIVNAGGCSMSQELFSTDDDISLNESTERFKRVSWEESTIIFKDETVNEKIGSKSESTHWNRASCDVKNKSGVSAFNSFSCSQRTTCKKNDDIKPSFPFTPNEHSTLESCYQIDSDTFLCDAEDFVQKTEINSDQHETLYKHLEKGETVHEVAAITTNTDSHPDGVNEFMQVKYTPGKCQNFVIDYGALRRSGYFLNYFKTDDNEILLNANCVSSYQKVEDWLDSSPQDFGVIQDMDEMIDKEEFHGGLASGECPLKNKFTEDAANKLKQLLCNQNAIVRYTSNPASTLTYADVESILETATLTLNNYLEKEKDRSLQRFRYVYVRGKFETLLPRGENNKTSFHATSTSGGLIQRVKAWFSMYLKSGQNINLNQCQQCRAPDDVNETAEKHQIILEPYHGPIAVTGAVIQSGSPSQIRKNGLFVTVVEEIKVVLRAINEALRRPYLKSPFKFPPVLLSKQHEDVEMMKLTGILQNNKYRRRSTFRTVFGLRNVNKIPPSLTIRRRRLPSRRFMGTVNGWLQRRIDRPEGNRRRRNQSTNDATLRLHRRLSNGVNRQNSEPLTRRTLTNIITSVRSFLPIQLSPVAPDPAVRHPL